MRNTVKVISLARSQERRATFAANNAHIDFEFFDAVDGQLVMSQVDGLPELFEKDLPYVPGALGCAVSHLMLWQEAAESDAVITVLEDDAVLRFDFHEQSAEILNNMPADWDIVVWGWNFDSTLALNLMPGVSPTVMLFDQQQLRGSIAGFQEMKTRPQLLALTSCFGTPAYSISPAGARKFMSQCFPLKKFTQYFPVLRRELRNNGIDMAMNRIYSSTNSFCSLPPLAVTRNEAVKSTISTGAR
jgi:GR25 family glycosyltransferase involved in LPS biosynthesis